MHIRRTALRAAHFLWTRRPLRRQVARGRVTARSRRSNNHAKWRYPGHATIFHALLVAALLAVAGGGLASIGLDEPAVVAFLVSGMLLIVKSGRSPASRA